MNLDNCFNLLYNIEVDLSTERMKDMNILIKDIRALLPDGDGFSVKNTSVCISGNKITGVGDVPEDFIPEKIIPGKDRLLIPGLSNCHTHAYMSLFRNIADDLAFDDWLFGNILPLEDRITKEDGLWGNLLACIEMLRTGTTAYMDMGTFTCIAPEAAKMTGIRTVVSRGLVGEGRNEAGRVRLEAARAEMERYADEPLVSFALAPHAIYTCDSEYLKIVSEEAKRLGVPINIHLSESKKEYDDSVASYGKTPTAYLDSLGLFENKTIAAHCVWMTDEDCDIFARNGVYAVHDPKSNFKLANGISPFRKMKERGVRVCVGTDSAASNNTLNMFSEMNFISLIHKGVNSDCLAASATQVLKCAVETGAEALGTGGGRIEAGRTADLVVMNLNYPSMRPANNYVSALAYSASGYEVETVIVNGDIVLENGKCTKIDEEEVYYNVEKITERLRNGK